MTSAWPAQPSLSESSTAMTRRGAAGSLAPRRSLWTAWICSRAGRPRARWPAGSTRHRTVHGTCPHFATFARPSKNKRHGRSASDHGLSGRHGPRTSRPATRAVLVLRIDRRPGPHGAPRQPPRSGDVPPVCPLGGQGGMGDRGPRQDRTPRQPAPQVPAAPPGCSPPQLASTPGVRTATSLARESPALARIRTPPIGLRG